MMIIQKLSHFQMDELIKKALLEDLPYDDVAISALGASKRRASVDLIAKAEGVLAGLDVFKRVFTYLEDSVLFTCHYADGDEVKSGDLILKVEGSAQTLLLGERVALNFLQRMSWIATKTRSYLKALEDSPIKLFDTRKTTPGLRIFEKYAVRVGGGYNHRYNLSELVMLKDNHISLAGSIKEAVEKVRAYSPFVRKIEVEVESLAQVDEAIEAGADIIMLDNMPLSMIEEAIRRINKRALIECSGNISLETIKDYRKLSIDYLSCGKLTHEICSLDLSMKNLHYL